MYTYELRQIQNPDVKLIHCTTFLERKDSRGDRIKWRKWKNENGKRRNYTIQTIIKGEKATILKKP